LIFFSKLWKDFFLLLTTTGLLPVTHRSYHSHRTSFTTNTLSAMCVSRNEVDDNDNDNDESRIHHSNTFHFIQQNLLFPPPGPQPQQQQQPQQLQQSVSSESSDLILFSNVNEIFIQNTTNHLQAIEKIWNAEKFCSGGLLRGQLARDKTLTQHRRQRQGKGQGQAKEILVDLENGDRVLYPRSVGEVAAGGGSRRQTNKSKPRVGSVARSLSPMSNQTAPIAVQQLAGDSSSRNSKIVFTDGGGNLTEKFSSVLSRIVENDRDKYS
jgi:hypothetical protein